MREKLCSRCGVTKPVGEFSQRSDRPGALRSHCKNCRRDGQKEHAQRIHRRYGISQETYEELAKDGCNICGIPRGRSRRLNVDHCHDTGVVRGVLCDDCNLALGKMNDDPELLRLAADYLDKPPARCKPQTLST